MKKIRKLQVQVNFPGSYSVFYLVFFFNFSWYYYTEKDLLRHGDNSD